MGYSREIDKMRKGGLSVEDKEFLCIIDREYCKGEDGRWIALLPFRVNKSLVSNNRNYVFNRMIFLR